MEKLFCEEFENFLLNGSKDELKTIISGSIPDKLIEFVNSLIERKNNPEASEEDWSELKYDCDKLVKKDGELGDLALKLLYSGEYHHPNTSSTRKQKLIALATGCKKLNHSKPSYTVSNDNHNLGLEDEVLKSEIDFHQVFSAEFESLKPENFKPSFIKKLRQTSLIDLEKLSDDMLNSIIIEDNKYWLDLNLKLASPIFYERLVKQMVEITRSLPETNSKVIKVNNLILHLASNSTTSQVEILYNLLKNSSLNYDVVLNNILTRKFNSRLENTIDKFEILKILYEIRAFIQDKPSKYDSIKVDINLQILQLSELLNKFDIEVFLDYIKNPLFIEGSTLKSSQEKKQIEKSTLLQQKRQKICNFSSANNRDSELAIKNYLIYFFLHEDRQLSELSAYFNGDYIEKIFYSSQLLKGNDTYDYKSLLGSSEYQSISDLKLLTICKHNKTQFCLDEEVKIVVDIKNISTLFIKIFEINTENYYLKNKSSIDNNMSLDGLVPSFEETYCLPSNKLLQTRREFTFINTIQGKRGLYFIEFFGGGISSRAIIKLGMITPIEVETPDGQIYFLLDEKDNIIISKSAGIWIQDIFYPVANEKGGILVPYFKSEFTVNAVVVSDGLSEISSVRCKSEKYSLAGEFIVNHESVIMGSTVKVLFRPQLFVNNTKINVSLLKNVKATIRVNKIENSQEIPVEQVFENLVLKDNEESIFEFQVPTKLTQFLIDVQGEIEVKTSSLNTKLNVSRNFTVKEKDSKYVNFYLINDINRGYILQLLGKAGETKPNVKINCAFNSRLFKETKDVNAITDDKGEVVLGQLQNVSLKVSTNYLGLEVSRKFSFTKRAHAFEPINLDILTHEEVNLPFNTDIFPSDNYYVAKVFENNQQLLEDIISVFNSKDENKSQKNLAIFEAIDANSGILNLKNLEVGLYQVVSVLSNNPICTIKVREGEVWSYDNYIKSEGTIFEIKQSNQFSYISDIKIESNNISAKLSNFSDKTRIHVFAYNFKPKVECYTSKLLSSMFSRSFGKNAFQKSKMDNIYLSNRLLHDEIQYVLDRKQQERIMGNNLDKPSLLMKRQFIRNTTTEAEKINQGTSFDSLDMESKVSCNKKKRCASKKKEECDDNSEDAENENEESEPTDFVYSPSFSFNFLSSLPVIMFNLTPDSEGKIQFKVDNLNQYSVVDFVVINDNAVTEKIQKNPHYSGFSRCNLTLKEPLDSSFAFSENREINLKQTNDNLVIEDITCTSFKILDSIESYFSYLKLVSNSTVSLFESQLSKLLQFDSLNENEKYELVSKAFSHELNIFIYFKHPKIFDAMIKPIIKLKAEKTFIDFFLLEDKAALEYYANPTVCNTLNSFEKCLLVFSLRASKKQEAQNITNDLKQKYERCKFSQNEMKRFFNIIMNLKMENAEMKLEKNAKMPESMSDAFFGAPLMGMAPQKMMMKRCIQENAKVSLSLVNSAIQKRNLFQEAGSSKEYCETHYLFPNQSGDFRDSNNIWYDLANFFMTHSQEDLASNFLSSGILIPPSSPRELAFIISLIDLPAKSVQQHEFAKSGGLALDIKLKTNAVIFTKRISKAEFDLKKSLMIANVIEPNTSEHSESSKKEFHEYISNEVYKMETIQTNISSQPLSFEVLIQIPQGAIPVLGSEYTRTVNITASRFETKSQDTYFYFPYPGEFKHYAPSISIDGKVVARSKNQDFIVSSKRIFKGKEEGFESLTHVIETGTKSEVLSFLKGKDSLSEDDLSSIYWLLKDREFCQEVINLLKERGVYSQVVWDYGINNHFFEDIIMSTNLIPKDIFDNQYKEFTEIQHLDYHPIINSRVHSIARNGKRNILNKEFKESYTHLILDLLLKKLLAGKVSSFDQLRFTYYLILQERFEEAIFAFEKVDKLEFNNLNDFTIQYDYIAAYLNFSKGSLSDSRALCNKYKNFPILYWRGLFEDIENQLDEYEGMLNLDELEVQNANNLKKANKSAASEAKLSFSLENSNLSILYSESSLITIKFFTIDIEMLHSRTPFIKQQGKNTFSCVKESFKEELQVENTTKEAILTYSIPDKFKVQNNLIEVSSNGKTQIETYFSNSMKISISESFGEIKVSNLKLEPQSKVYIKCFAKLKDTTVKFYKDGYTDLRGKFNFVIINSDILKDVELFSILVMHDSLGSVIKECNPPVIQASIQKEDALMKQLNMGFQNMNDVIRTNQQQIMKDWKTKSKI